MIDVSLETVGPFGPPHEPKFEDIVATAALGYPITGVKRHVIMFVLLEEVLCAHLIAAEENSLNQK